MEEAEMTLATTGVQTLAVLDEEPKTVAPIDVVENSLAQFVKDAFRVTDNDFNFNKKMQEELAGRMGSMENNELIALFNISNQALNDKLAKLIGPTMGAVTSHNDAIVAASRAPVAGTNIQINNMTGTAKDEAVAQAVTPEVASGLDMLDKLSRLLSSVPTLADDQETS